jgi:serine/threonine-protein kinase
MSEVYRARDSVIGRTVAVKILTDAGCADPEVKARFLQEARLAGNIDHDNVVSIFDFGEDELHRPYMVMEFLRGMDLRHAIRGGHLGDLQAKLRIALQIARALGYIHSINIVHRDIKPDNIQLTTNGIVKLMDFGIAKAQGLSMTRTGVVMGTPFYMAPEQVLGENIGPEVDIYAFGALFFELLTGVQAIRGDTIERVFYAILNEPLDLTPLRGGVPDPVCDLIVRCTAKKAAQRPASFEIVAGEIERILAAMEAPTLLTKPAPPPASAPLGETQLQPTAATRPGQSPLPLVAPPPAPAMKKPWPKAWLAVGLGVVLLAAIAVLVKLAVAPRHRTEPSPPPVAVELASSLSTPSGDMVLVPAGRFLYGEHKTPVTLPAFYIDKTEVTNAAYERFCKETGHSPPPHFQADKQDYPVVYVTIADAREFARWAGKRLPKAQEWEKAARGDQGRSFPWGDQKDPSFANVYDNASLAKHEIMPAGSFLQGASPYGALNMVGNVWEFVNETEDPIPENMKFFAKRLKPPPAAQEPWYEIRGDSFDQDPAPYPGIWEDVAVPVRWNSPNIGFRCVKDPEPAH